MRLKPILKLLTPPILLRLRNRFGQLRTSRRYGISGDFRSWEEALSASTGYDNNVILEKTKAALLKVKDGTAVYERDSVTFDQIHYSWPLLACLMWVAAGFAGRLNVIDFGGSLGSTFFQNRVFLSQLPQVRWNIIEQLQHVKIGQAYFQTDDLRFYSDIESCLDDSEPNVALFSSVLQYLERPYSVLDQMHDLSCDHVIIDRTPFWSGPENRLCVQTVPPSIYPASYPIWIFSSRKFQAFVNREWRVMAEFDSFDSLHAPVTALWKGFFLERRVQ